jgi:hypothetical protein
MLEDRFGYGWEILERPDVALHDGAGGPFLYRPGQIVVDAESVDRLGDLLGDYGAEPDDDADVQSGTGIRRFRCRPGADVLELVERARAIAPGAIAPNHIILGAPARIGGPAGPAAVAPAPSDIPGLGQDGTGHTIAVLDTGISGSDVTTMATGDDVDELDAEPDAALDLEAGHGTFIAGIISRIAPSAQIRSIRVLDSYGIGDDVGIASGLLRSRGDQVINLSLGGPALDAAGTPALERAIEALPRETVVVASAGNDGRAVPFFPAAFKRVISVGAVEQAQGGWKRAGFSNFGWWVDACAPGVAVHSVFPRFTETSAARRDFSAGGAKWDGTSFAAPQVAACIAALASRMEISCEEAAWHLIHAPGRPRMTAEQLGTLVDPGALDAIA